MSARLVGSCEAEHKSIKMWRKPTRLLCAVTKIQKKYLVTRYRVNFKCIFMWHLNSKLLAHFEHPLNFEITLFYNDILYYSQSWHSLMSVLQSGPVNPSGQIQVTLPVSVGSHLAPGGHGYGDSWQRFTIAHLKPASCGKNTVNKAIYLWPIVGACWIY